MLDADRVDLDAVSHALSDRTPGTAWWIERATGLVRAHPTDAEGGPAEPEWLRIEPIGSRESYQDIAEFVAGVQHRRAAALLDRAIEGRGAFRRFKNTLFEFPELRDQWYRLRDARSRRRALMWLADAGLITAEDAARVCARYPDPSPQNEDVPAAVALDLREVYGDRLHQVLVHGSWARGDGTVESGLGLLVVLDEVPSVWVELKAMDDVLWRHTERSGVTITALPVGHADFARPRSPVLTRAKVEAVRIA